MLPHSIQFVGSKEDCMPLLGNKSLQEMEILNWNKENIPSAGLQLSTPLSKKQLFADNPDVF